MHIDIPSLLAGVGLTTALLMPALAWLLKTIISHELTKALDRNRNELELRLQRHQIRFSALHQRRAEVIHELYKRIITVRRMCALLKTENQDINDVVGEKACDDIVSEVININFYFGDHALYFPDTVIKKYKSLFTTAISETLTAIGMIDLFDNFEKMPPEWRKKFREAVFPILKEKLADFDAILFELKAEFQSLLGLDQHTDT